MRKNIALILQIAIWVGLWAMLSFLGDDRLKPPGFLLLGTLRIGSVAVLFNLTYWVLMPIYLSKGQKRKFFAWSLLVFVVFLGSQVFIDDLFMPYRPMPMEMPPRPRIGLFLLVPQLFVGLVVFATAAMLRSFSAYEKKKQDEEAANRRRAEAELALLKSQINPHFLLNTLNNLYGISLTQPGKTPEALLKLSDMVKYILYECAHPAVPLERDLDFVKNYIALQRLRLPPNARLNVDISERLPEKSIEPMVLIPFIENAFKHGLTTRQPCEISIFVKYESQQLVLQVENQYFATNKTSDNTDESGIGLANTGRRLEQSYPGRHTLNIENDGQRHRVHLRIEL